MLRSGRPGVGFVPFVEARSYLQTARFIREPILVGYFRFGSVKDVATRRCPNGRRQARPSIKIRTTLWWIRGKGVHHGDTEFHRGRTEKTPMDYRSVLLERM